MKFLKDIMDLMMTGIYLEIQNLSLMENSDVGKIKIVS